MQIPIDIDGFVEFKVDAVTANILLLLGLKGLKEIGILLHYLEDRLKHKASGTHYPVTYKQGYSFWKCNYTNILPRRNELQ